ncbi:amidohydrolase family protein [Variovorax sp. Sphag1AA]|uniref:amidohydrolase family protein n=1 Tax=Variovorax sp. Sphag1AA TaxID=2587027 RepID=UPI00160C549D|nr:amidohydrolase family protein [Variovorax sp. Sphag1AA]MBB3181443.1 putative TIM-barrel fold metal-dependent hydrolase [Variovorax sp. Sphag1AA]
MSLTDWHTHWLPARLVDALARRKEGPRIDLEAKRLLYADSSLVLWDTYHDIDARLRLLDETGIDRQVLSLPGLFRIDSLPVAEAEPLVRIFNDETRALVRSRPERFSGLVALPIADPARAAEVFERELAEGVLIGAILPVDAFLSHDDAQAWKPVLAVAQRWHAHLFVHPGPVAATLPAAGAEGVTAIDNAAYRRGAQDLQSRITSAAITLAFTDLLDDYPDVTVQVANLGGTLPFIVERFDAIDLRDRGAIASRERLRRIYVDTASLGAGAIALAARTFGADRLLFGSDLPIFSADLPIAGFREAAIPLDQAGAVQPSLVPREAKA